MPPRAVDEARTAARRHGDPAWRLLGIEVDLVRPEAVSNAPRLPSLDEWAAEEGVGDWSEREQLRLYAERFRAQIEAGEGGGVSATSRPSRLQTRNARLR